MRDTVKIYMINSLGFNANEANEFAALAVQTVREYIRNINGAFVAMNIDQIKISLHNFKGSLLNMGLDDLAKKIEEIETLCTDHGPDEAKLHFYAFFGNLDIK